MTNLQKYLFAAYVDVSFQTEDLRLLRTPGRCMKYAKTTYNKVTSSPGLKIKSQIDIPP